MEIQRESIFVSVIRTFCRFFFGIVAIFLAFILCSIFYSMISPSPLLKEKTNLEILPDARGNRQIASPHAPVILQIPITGVIGDPKNVNTENLENILIESRMGLLSRDRVKGILLFFNTPGGTVVDSDNIYRMLQDYKAKYKVPIFGYVDGLCASGGMYIASSADQMFASSSSIVGSVGVVIGPFFNVYDAMGKIGVHARTLTEGLDKDMMNPTRPWKEGEDASLKAVMAFFYEQFVNIVTRAHPRLDREKLVSEYGAQVFDCVEAQKLGYVDHALSSRKDALLALLREARIDLEKPYQVVQLAPKQDLLSELIQGKSPLFTGKIEHSVDLGQDFLQGQAAYLYQPLN